MPDKKIDWSSLYKKEDWWALWLGMIILFLYLGALWGIDLMGWVVKTSVWGKRPLNQHLQIMRVFNSYIHCIACTYNDRSSCNGLEC